MIYDQVMSLGTFGVFNECSEKVYEAGLEQRERASSGT
jgi:hypothetical protein